MNCACDEINRLERNLQGTTISQGAEDDEDDEEDEAEQLDQDDWRNKEFVRVMRLLDQHNCTYKKRRVNRSSSVNWLCKTKGCHGSVTIDRQDQIINEFTYKERKDLDENEDVNPIFHNHLPLDPAELECAIAEGIMEQRARRA